jgi:hypothetical protein
MVGFLNAVSSGFDGSLMGGINAMPQYLHYVRRESCPLSFFDWDMKFNYESSGKATVRARLNSS